MKFKAHKIGLSIRGGGTKSVAYAGALKAFEEMGIEISAIVSASGGAVVGGSYAVGKNPNEIFEHFKTFKPYSIFSFRSLLSGQPITYSTWEKHARIIARNTRVEETKIKLFIQATDVSTQQTEYIEEGDLAKAVIASSAVLSPYRFRRRRYIDGEYSPEYGIQKLQNFGCDLTFIINLIEPNKGFSFLDIIRFAQTKALDLDEDLHPSTYKISIKIPLTFPFSQKNSVKLFDAGYKQTLRFLRNL